MPSHFSARTSSFKKVFRELDLPVWPPAQSPPSAWLLWSPTHSAAKRLGPSCALCFRPACLSVEPHLGLVCYSGPRPRGPLSPWLSCHGAGREAGPAEERGPSPPRLFLSREPKQLTLLSVFQSNKLTELPLLLFRRGHWTPAVHAVRLLWSSSSRGRRLTSPSGSCSLTRPAALPRWRVVFWVHFLSCLGPGCGRWAPVSGRPRARGATVTGPSDPLFPGGRPLLPLLPARLTLITECYLNTT